MATKITMSKFKTWFLSILIILSVTIYGCASPVSGLKSFADVADGYKFLYPNGWIPVDIEGKSAGVDTVLRDLIERSENLSVIISDVPANKKLQDLGTPSDVGYRFLKKVNQNSNSDRQTDFLRAESREVNGKTYYILEYQVQNANAPERHNLASVAVNRGKLYTFNISTEENRWDKVKDVFEVAVKSFTLDAR
jgi:photosystem II oxygen-evolving enhancer protein 2